MDIPLVGFWNGNVVFPFPKIEQEAGGSQSRKTSWYGKVKNKGGIIGEMRVWGLTVERRRSLIEEIKSQAWRCPAYRFRKREHAQADRMINSLCHPVNDIQLVGWCLRGEHRSYCLANQGQYHQRSDWPGFGMLTTYPGEVPQSKSHPKYIRPAAE